MISILEGKIFPFGGYLTSIHMDKLKGTKSHLARMEKVAFFFFYQFSLIQKKKTFKIFQSKKILFRDRLPNDLKYREQTTF